MVCATGNRRTGSVKQGAEAGSWAPVRRR
jgi:putative ABC transport system permease protein